MSLQIQSFLSSLIQSQRTANSNARVLIVMNNALNLFIMSDQLIFKVNQVSPLGH